MTIKNRLDVHMVLDSTSNVCDMFQEIQKQKTDQEKLSITWKEQSNVWLQQN